ncbi:site-specific integrase, partial [Escherichia coli]|nr:site-specific integrase [Escherichia coli]
ASAARQATGVIKILQGDILRSVGTVRNYEQGLTRVAEWMKDNRINHGDLRTLTPAQAITYLEQRGEQVGQKTLDMERQAIQAMMIHVTQTRPAGEHLPVVKSEQAQILSSRAYSPDQVALIAAAQQPANALATAIALAAGL